MYIHVNTYTTQTYINGHTLHFTHTQITCDGGGNNLCLGVLCGTSAVGNHDSTTLCHGDGYGECGNTSNDVGLFSPLGPHWKVTELKDGRRKSCTASTSTAVVVSNEASCNLQSKLFERLLCSTGVVGMEDVRIRLKKETRICTGRIFGSSDAHDSIAAAGHSCPLLPCTDCTNPSLEDNVRQCGFQCAPCAGLLSVAVAVHLMTTV